MLLPPPSFPAMKTQANRMSVKDNQENELGKMPSMSNECTPAKHRYDDCFNKWFEDYLGLSKGIGESSGSSTTSGGSSSKSSFWSSSSRSSSSSSHTSPIDAIQGGPQRTQVERKALRERLDGECGEFWKEYQSCVLRAVKERDLDGLIQEAQVHNPFPFPKDIPKSKPNNEPFPFPAGEKSR